MATRDDTNAPRRRPADLWQDPRPVSPDEPRGLDVGDPLAALPPAARHVLGASLRMLVERGYDSLTIEGVALEAGETPRTVLRYFGSKAGLIEAILDSCLHDAYHRLATRVEALPPGEERLVAYVTGLRDLAEDTRATNAIFRIVPHALHDPVLRPRVAALYAWYRELTLREAGLAPAGAEDRRVTSQQSRTPRSASEAGPPPADRRRLEALAAVMLAALDGLSFQAALDPDGFDAEAAFDVLAELLRRVSGTS